MYVNLAFEDYGRGIIFHTDIHLKYSKCTMLNRQMSLFDQACTGTAFSRFLVFQIFVEFDRTRQNVEIVAVDLFNLS